MGRFKAFQRTAESSPPLIDKASLQHFVIALRQRGVKPVSCNTYIKAMNAYCRWLHEGGHHQERLELPTLRVEKLVIQTLGDEQIRRLLTVKPKRFDQWRLHALIALLLDSGIRIDEALTLRLAGRPAQARIPHVCCGDATATKLRSRACAILNSARPTDVPTLRPRVVVTSHYDGSIRGKARHYLSHQAILV